AQHVVNGDHEPAQDGADEHAGGDDDAQRIAAVGARTGGAGHGQDAHDEGERGHEDRPQPLARGFLGRVNDAQALLLHELDAELDNQDRVLGFQADQHDQPDLAEDVQRQIEDPEANDG